MTYSVIVTWVNGHSTKLGPYPDEVTANKKAAQLKRDYAVLKNRAPTVTTTGAANARNK